jgi:hypothetical protein
MIADLGNISLLLAFGTSIFAALAGWIGMRRNDDRWVSSARNAVILVFPLVLLAALAIIYSLVTSDFSLDYVWQVSSRDMPTYLKITALWGGQAGSLLFWNLLMAAFTAAAMATKWRDQKALMPYVIIVASMTQIFFLFISAFVENPFVRLAIIPPDGNGLNPLLRHPGMIIHPPMLYLGFVGFTVPYAFAMAALMSNQAGDNWIRTTRRWTLVAWLFLSHDPGEDADVQDVEHVPHRPHLLSGHPGHLRGPQWRHLLGPCLCPIGDRPLLLRLHRHHVHLLGLLDHHPPRPAALREPAPLLPVARGRLSLQQLPDHRHPGRGLPVHLLSHLLRTVYRREGVRWAAGL